MTRKQALALAIAALQKEYKQWLYASNSDAADKRRAEIAQAIEALDNMKRQQDKRIWRMVTLRHYDGRRMMKRSSVEEAK